MTTPQFRLVYAITRKLGYDNAVLHALVRDMFGKDHLRDLREDESRHLIDRLKELAGQTPNAGYRDSGMKAERSGTVIEYCSAAQAYMIRYLCRAADVDQVRLWGIIKTRWGLRRSEHDLRDLTHKQAEHLILQLKTFARRAQAVAQAEERQGEFLPD